MKLTSDTFHVLRDVKTKKFYTESQWRQSSHDVNDHFHSDLNRAQLYHDHRKAVGTKNAFRGKHNINCEIVPCAVRRQLVEA